MENNDLDTIAQNLRKINFGADGIIRPDCGSKDYDYNSWKSKGKHCYDNAQKCYYCTQCDDMLQGEDVISKESELENKEKYRFTNVSHGTHMLDFLQAHGEDKSKLKHWSQKPVIFVMENPSNTKGNAYHQFDDSNAKCPSESWYWLSKDYTGSKQYLYPNYFSQKEYGNLVYSIMNTFCIANGYVTNMVKCGVGKNNDEFTTTDNYNNKIVECCIESKLQNELDKIRRKSNEKVIIFAFSNRTFEGLKKYLKDENTAICLLPHPANRLLANDYRKYVLLGKIIRMLLQNGFYEAEDGNLPTKPDLEHLIVNDKTEDELKTVTIEDKLNAYVFGGVGTKKKKSYEDNVLCYESKYTDGDELSKIVFRYYKAEGLSKEKKYKCSYSEYDFIDRSISFYLGEKKTANIQEDVKFKDYFVYNAMIDFLSENFEIKEQDINIIKKEK